jgi:hypothetical protein
VAALALAGDVIGNVPTEGRFEWSAGEPINGWARDPAAVPARAKDQAVARWDSVRGWVPVGPGVPARAPVVWVQASVGSAGSGRDPARVVRD